jgi:hypothetical protein
VIVALSKRLKAAFSCVALCLISLPLNAQIIDKVITQEIWQDTLKIETEVGLEFRGGLEYRLKKNLDEELANIISEDELGEFSAIEFVHQRGETPRFVAFSDHQGLWIEVEIKLKNGWLNGMTLLRMGVLLDPENKHKALVDIESVNWHEGTYQLAFENSGKLWTFNKLGDTPEIGYVLQDFHNFPENGIESLTRLPDGRLLAVAELQSASKLFVSPANLKDQKRSQTRAAWVETKAGSRIFDPLAIKTPDGLSPGGSTTLANGDVLILFKKFHLLRRINSIAIQRFSAEDFTSQALVAGRSLLKVRSKTSPQLVLDNMEGISSFQREGETFVMIASDNNLNWKHQKNRLLLFRLK